MHDTAAALDFYARAFGAVLRPLADQFYGERSGTVRDPFGHEWLLGGGIEKVSPEGNATAIYGDVRMISMARRPGFRFTVDARRS